MKKISSVLWLAVAFLETSALKAVSWEFKLLKNTNLEREYQAVRSPHPPAAVPLTELHIQHSRSKRQIPPELIRDMLPNTLTSLNLSGASFSREAQDDFPPVLLTLTRLTTLNLSGTNFISFYNVYIDTLSRATMQSGDIFASPSVDRFLERVSGLPGGRESQVGKVKAQLRNLNTFATNIPNTLTDLNLSSNGYLFPKMQTGRDSEDANNMTRNYIRHVIGRLIERFQTQGDTLDLSNGLNGPVVLDAIIAVLEGRPPQARYLNVEFTDNAISRNEAQEREPISRGRDLVWLRPNSEIDLGSKFIRNR